MCSESEFYVEFFLSLYILTVEIQDSERGLKIFIAHSCFRHFLGFKNGMFQIYIIFILLVDKKKISVDGALMWYIGVDEVLCSVFGASFTGSLSYAIKKWQRAVFGQTLNNRLSQSKI